MNYKEVFMLAGCPHCGKEEDCPRCPEFPRPKAVVKKATPKKKATEK